MILTTFIIACIGLCISLYGFFVEYKIKEDPTYHPVCDINDQISCSKTFLSPYGQILKVSNTIIGALFYSGMMLCAWLNYTMLIWYGSIAAALASILFAYVLFFKVRTICLVCISIYLVNVALLISAYMMR